MIKKQRSRHSDELQEIISAPPSWLIRWGASVFIVILLMLFVLARYVRFPEIYKTKLVVKVINNLTSSNDASQHGNALYYGEISLPQNELSGLNKNAKVLINFEAYPQDIYGAVSGHLNNIHGNVASDGNFKLVVKFNQPINKEINLRSGLIADAAIVKRDFSLWEKVITKIGKF